MGKRKRRDDEEDEDFMRKMKKLVRKFEKRKRVEKRDRRRRSKSPSSPRRRSESPMPETYYGQHRSPKTTANRSRSPSTHIRQSRSRITTQRSGTPGTTTKGTPPQQSPGSSTRELPKQQPPPMPPLPPDELDELTGDTIPEDLLAALGSEGQELQIVGDDLLPELVQRWKNIIQNGLGKEARETILKKYPNPGNFPTAIPPKLNLEIAASLSESSVKRDKRMMNRQMLLGKMLVAMGRTLTNILKGNIQTKEIVEHLNDSAKITAEIYHQDLESRKFFALTATSGLIRDCIKKSKTDEYLFGKDCGEQIKAAQTIQKTGSQIKTSDKKTRENWKSPLQTQQQHRSGPPYPQKNRQPIQRTQPVHRSQAVQRTQSSKRRPQQKTSQTRYRRHH